jgi:hypothetical protein
VPRVLIGSLDLGQAVDYTAFAAAEVTRRLEGKSAVARYAVRRLKRWPLGTPYHDIADDLKGQFASAPLAGCDLLIDKTGVGAAVLEIFQKAGIRAVLRPVLITSGQKATAEGPGFNVPKKDLAGALVAAFQSRRVGIAAGLPEAAVLAKELAAFRVKVTAAGNETFEAWRDRDHDDLVLAVAMAVWYGERWRPQYAPSAGGRTPPSGPASGPGVFA